jgi:ArsR family transcriptional regulator
MYLTPFHCLVNLPNKMNKSASSLQTAQQRAAVVKALAHPSRLLIVDALHEGERCVRELTTLVGADISTVSKHLALLKSAGFVEVEKRGLNQFYRLRCPCLMDFFHCIDLVNRAKAEALLKAAS